MATTNTDEYSVEMNSIKQMINNYNSLNSEEKKINLRPTIRDIIKGPLFEELDNNCDVVGYNENKDKDAVKGEYNTFIDELLGTGNQLTTLLESVFPIDNKKNYTYKADVLKNNVTTNSSNFKALFQFMTTNGKCLATLFQELIKRYRINLPVTFKITYDNQSNNNNNKQKEPQPNQSATTNGNSNGNTIASSFATTAAAANPPNNKKRGQAVTGPAATGPAVTGPAATGPAATGIAAIPSTGGAPTNNLKTKVRTTKKKQKKSKTIKKVKRNTKKKSKNDKIITIVLPKK